VNIDGAVVLVTGANRGLGKSFVRAMLGAGAAKIYAGARKPSEVVAADNVVPLKLDITNERDVETAAETCQDITILVNNAGIAHFTPLIAAPSMVAARDEIAVNYLGTLAMCRAFAPALGQNGGGAIVNVLSVVSWITVPISGSYAVSKAAELAMTNGIRVELRSQGTLVVGVHAGYIDTDMTAHSTVKKTAPETVVAATLAAIQRNETEVLADERSRDVRRRLFSNPGSLDDEMQEIWDKYVATSSSRRPQQ
jgi:NAD(P)-dependent dehydrogenase (short-subunit alcohol dehydrogenase family)